MISLINNSKRKSKRTYKSKRIFINKSKQKKINLNKTKHTKKSNTKLSNKLKNKKTIEKYCSFYKHDITGKLNKQLYRSCKINKYCRKYKCKSIDDKMIKEQKKKLGQNYNTLILSSLRAACPITTDEENYKNRIKCETKSLHKFYKANNLNELYNKVIECDKKTCSKEKQIFNTNLFRQKQIRLKKKQREIIDADKFMENADQEMIEKN
jgi:hypothetical protein